MKTEKRKVTCRKGHFIESQSPEQPENEYCSTCANYPNDDICNKCDDTFCMYKPVKQPKTSQERKPTNRTIERDMAVIYENYIKDIKDNNIKDKELDLLHRLYAKLYCEVSFLSKTDPLQGERFKGKEGWECPRCHAIHSYLKLSCDCPPLITTSATFEQPKEDIKIPQWYSKQEMYDWLITHSYSKEIANELSMIWADDLQGAFQKGWEKAKHELSKQLQPKEVEGRKTAEEIKEKYHSITKEVCEGYQHEHIIEAMHEFHSQFPAIDLRSKLNEIKQLVKDQIGEEQPSGFKLLTNYYPIDAEEVIDDMFIIIDSYLSTRPDVKKVSDKK
jgi:hypothetical protein